MRQVNLHEAKTHLSRLVNDAVAGEEVVIARAGKPLVKLVPVEQARPRRQGGAWKGRVWVSPDFDAPLPPDIQAAFDGEGD